MPKPKRWTMTDAEREALKADLREMSKGYSGNLAWEAEAALRGLHDSLAGIAAALWVLLWWIPTEALRRAFR